MNCAACSGPLNELFRVGAAGHVGEMDTNPHRAVVHSCEWCGGWDIDATSKQALLLVVNVDQWSTQGSMDGARYFRALWDVPGANEPSHMHGWVARHDKNRLLQVG